MRRLLLVPLVALLMGNHTQCHPGPDSTDPNLFLYNKNIVAQDLHINDDLGTGDYVVLWEGEFHDVEPLFGETTVNLFHTDPHPDGFVQGAVIPIELKVGADYNYADIGVGTLDWAYFEVALPDGMEVEGWVNNPNACTNDTTPTVHKPPAPGDDPECAHRYQVRTFTAFGQRMVSFTMSHLWQHTWPNWPGPPPPDDDLHDWVGHNGPIPVLGLVVSVGRDALFTAPEVALFTGLSQYPDSHNTGGPGSLIYGIVSTDLLPGGGQVCSGTWAGDIPLAQSELDKCAAKTIMGATLTVVPAP